jgi:DNA-binding transcriptional LysR family regulator
MLSSDELRLFLAVMREGNMLAAGRRAGVDHSTVARRLTRLEQVLGARLFDRSPRGLAPTPAAFALLGHAERVESELLAAAASVAGQDRTVVGTVRLATPEMFGSHVVAPHVPLLRARHPGLLLELAPESRSISLSKREADIAIMLGPPPRGRLVARKLADYRLGLYGARHYLAAQPGGVTRDSLPDHPFVSYIDELAGFPGLIALDQVLPEAGTVFRSSSSAAQLRAVAAGTGLGMLHVVAADQNPELVRLLSDQIVVTRSYWLIVHADLQQLPRVRAVIDFLDEVVRGMKGQL